MAVVRYVALAALVVWLGGMLGALFGDMLRHAALVTFASGSVIFISLLAMKVVGPPPRAFFARAAIVVLMLAGAVLAAIHQVARSTILLINVTLGFVLLGWYVRE